MADPNGWPDEARKKALLAAATRMRDACQWGGPAEDWLHDAERILNHDFGDLIAARVAEARAKALKEAAAVASKGETNTKEVSENPAYDADTRHTFYTMGRACKEIAAAIRALKEQSHG